MNITIVLKSVDLEEKITNDGFNNYSHFSFNVNIPSVLEYKNYKLLVSNIGISQTGNNVYVLCSDGLQSSNSYEPQASGYSASPSTVIGLTSSFDTISKITPIYKNGNINGRYNIWFEDLFGEKQIVEVDAPQGLKSFIIILQIECLK